jgi:hypothetical protein
MPSDDLILDVRQIAGYPPTADALQGDTLLLQRGIGGPYLSISAQALVATALATGGGPLDVSTGYAPADAVPMQIFTDNLVVNLGATHNWNCYFSSTRNAFAYTGNGPAAAFGFDGTAGFVWDAGPFGSAGSEAALTQLMQLSPIGQLILTTGSISLPRDPLAPNEAATAGWVGANTVASFNGRIGPVTLGTWDILYAGGAPIWSPDFGGCPTAPTPEPADISQRIATTAFVNTAINEFLSGFLASEVFVSSFNGRSGVVTLTTADVTAVADAIYAPLDSPNFTGYPTAPTAAQGQSTGQIATTAFVMNAVADSVTGVASFNTRTGAVVFTAADLTAVGGALLLSPNFSGTPSGPTAAPGTNTNQIATTAFVAQAIGSGFAPLNSPAFTGVPTAPTAAPTTNTDQIATTAFVLAAIPSTDAGVLSFNGRVGAVTLLANDISAAGGAPAMSPTFTGTPLGPTAAPGTNTQQLATTAFVMAALPTVPLASTSLPLMDGTAAVGVGSTWARSDHVHPTDTSRAAASALASYLLLSGGTITGNLAVNAGLSASSAQINNGTFSIFKGTAANPALYFNDGSTNRTSFYFNITSGSSTWTDNYSGANIAMGPTSVINLNGSNVNVNATANFNSNVSISGQMGSGSIASGPVTLTGNISITAPGTSIGGWALYNSSGGLGSQFYFNQANNQCLWTNNPLGSSITLGGDVSVAAGGGHNFLVTQGLGYQTGGGSWLSLSDARIKTVDGDYEDGLAEVIALRPVAYRYRGNDSLTQGEPSMNKWAADAGRPFVGLVAQEVEEVMPGMVTKRAGFIDGRAVTDLRSLDAGPLVYALVNAVKQLAARVAALEGA